MLQGPCLAVSAGEFLLRVSSSRVAEHSLNPSASNLRIKPVLFTLCLPAFLAFTPFCFLGQKIHYLRCCFTFGNPDISLARVSRASARPPSSSSGAGKHLKCFFCTEAQRYNSPAELSDCCTCLDVAQSTKKAQDADSSPSELNSLFCRLSPKAALMFFPSVH